MSGHQTPTSDTSSMGGRVDDPRTPVTASALSERLLLGALRDQDAAADAEAARADAETARAETEAVRQRLELALDAARMGVWDVDLVTDTARTSPRHDEIFGHPARASASSADVFRTEIMPEDGDVMATAYAQALDTGEFDVAIRISRPGGDLRWVHERGRVMYDASGRPTRMTGVTRDITDERTALEARRVADAHAHAALEQRIAERTADLARTNARLAAEIEARAQSQLERNTLLRRLAAAQETERRHLARELHDEVGQHLTALGLGLRGLTDVAPAGSEVDRRVGALRALVATLGRELHALAVQLRPRALDDFGLEAALAASAEAWTTRCGIAVTVHARVASDRLPAPVESAVYRIVQEALTNVARHSGAQHASVFVERRDGHVCVTVSDDGRGFDPGAGAPAAAVEGSGLGLLGIRERATLLGGTVDLEAAPGDGTTLFVRLPIATRPDAPAVDLAQARAHAA